MYRGLYTMENKYSALAADVDALFGAASNANEINKSFVTGPNEIVTEGATGGQAFRRQSLAADVKNLTFGNQDFTIYTIIPRKRANSVVEEYVIQDGYGEYGTSRAVAEIDIASVNNASIQRKIVRMKNLSDVRQVSLLSMQVDNIQEPLDFELNNAIMTVAKTIEYELFYGDADLTAGQEGTGLEFDGLSKLIPAENVIDLRGATLTEQDLNKAAVKISQGGFGTPTDAFLEVGAHANFVNNQLSRQWVTQGAASDLAAGFTVPKFVSARGQIALHGSTIMNKDRTLDLSVRPNPSAPAAPKVTAAVAAGAGKFFDDDKKAPLSYAVVLASKAGKSAPAQATVALDDVTKEVTLTIDLGMQVIGDPTHAEVFRFDAKSGQYSLIGRVPFSKATYTNGAFTMTFVDKNEVVAGTSVAFVGELTERTIALYELMPMFKMDLARVSAAETFAVMFSGALAIFAPKRWVKIVNVGSDL